MEIREGSEELEKGGSKNRETEARALIGQLKIPVTEEAGPAKPSSSKTFLPSLS